MRHRRAPLKLAAAALLAALAFAAPVACSRADRGTDMLSLQAVERDQKMRDDLEQIARYDEGLQEALLFAQQHPELFPERGLVDLTPEQKEDLRMVWGTVLDYMRALDGLKAYWRDFHRINPVTRRRDHARAFLVGYAAWMVQYKHGLAFIDLTVPKPPLETLLDEEVPEFAIPHQGFKALKWNIVNVKAVGRLLGSDQYARTLQGTLLRSGCDKDAACAAALARTLRYHDEAREQLKDRAAVHFSYNSFDIVRDFGFQAWFPVQKNVAEWMGDTKVRRLHKHLVSHEQLDAMQAQLEPGDVLVARHNWYLSNVGLPGFWPHAELYVGTWAEAEAYFNDPEVNAWVQHLPGNHASFTDYLRATYPEAWVAWTTTDPDDGTPRRVMEAVSEGVVLNSLYRACGADYVAAIRPRFSRLAKARALDQAFRYFGRPYDFNFDFLTDERLVCTELVYKAWQPANDKPGPPLQPSFVMGRTTLPANDLVRAFDANLQTAEPAWDFVYFLDGQEKAGTARVANVDDLRASWKRPKWDVLQR
jgi:hypothetical protein